MDWNTWHTVLLPPPPPPHAKHSDIKKQKGYSKLQHSHISTFHIWAYVSMKHPKKMQKPFENFPFFVIAVKSLYISKQFSLLMWAQSRHHNPNVLKTNITLPKQESASVKTQAIKTQGCREGMSLAVLWRMWKRRALERPQMEAVAHIRKRSDPLLLPTHTWVRSVVMECRAGLRGGQELGGFPLWCTWFMISRHSHTTHCESQK